MVFRIVSPNPALDRFVTVSTLRPGEHHRARTVETAAAGKGVNVARALLAWGGDAVVYAAAGGPTGEQFRTGLEREGIPHVITPVAGDTRINMKVREQALGGRVTEINEPGPPLNAAEEKAFVDSVLDELEEGDWLVLCGSLPPGVSPALYVACLVEAKGRGCRVAVDVPGETLAALLDASPAPPDVVAPNAAELAAWAEARHPGRRAPRDGFGWLRQPGAVRDALRELASDGVPHPFVTLGPAGAGTWTGKAAVRARALDVGPRRTVGTGDVFLAAVLLSLDDRGPVGAMRLGVALSGLHAIGEDLMPPDWFDGEERLADVPVEAL